MEKIEKKTIQSEYFIRNPDVVAEVLIRANGKCERCDSNAPFLRRRDNTPYLEVHHKTPLAEGGEDTVENTTALCPNCHRYLHYGNTL
ncbi:HNH endonuclease signature motif containing protein [Pectobacterium brasiliense]|uniref:HNH endonuclease n=1 Tax=Pectobacterium brasiliense TaxID=180957 RepID=UPI00227C9042|nr:HNH endonuclease signature motif containing protein [Pectobacterium brasiliense]WGL29477.1 HNH endonuclease signature motif containing protein [Pectobacterium brasiliense]